MGYENLRVEREGQVAVITIDRPDRLNAISRATHLEMVDACHEVGSDDSVRAVIWTGAGRGFCSGADLMGRPADTGNGDEPKQPPRAERLDEFSWVGNQAVAVYRLNKPVIAAVNGLAMGGGFEIALACDLLIADERAVFALPEPRVGLAALAGGLHRLPRIIGETAAMGMILTGRRVDAREGERLGFVNAVAPAGGVMAEAQRWAAQMLHCGPMSIRASKEAVRMGLAEPSLQAAIAGQGRYPAVAALFACEDFVEGPRAFAEKRPPAWKGR